MKKDGRVRVCIDFIKLNKESMPVIFFSLATHGPSGWQHCRSWDALHYGWFLWLQPDQTRRRRSGEDVVHNTLGDVLLRSNAFRSQTRATTHKGYDCNLSRYDAWLYGGVRRRYTCKIQDTRRTSGSSTKGSWKITKISVEDEPQSVCLVFRRRSDLVSSSVREEGLK